MSGGVIFWAHCQPYGCSGSPDWVFWVLGVLAVVCVGLAIYSVYQMMKDLK